MQIGDASRGIACWLYTNKRYGDQCVQFVQGLMPLDHWTEQPLGVLVDAASGDVDTIAKAIHEARSPIPWEVTSQQDLAHRDARAALSAMPDRQAAINEGLEMAAKERAAIVAWLRAYKRDDTNWPQVLATAIETGEHLK